MTKELVICRACLNVSAENGGCGYISIFKPLFETVKEGREDISEIERNISCLQCFNECTQLQLNPEKEEMANARDFEDYRENYNYLCEFCCSALINAYKFISTARQSDDILKKQDLGKNEEKLEATDLIEQLEDANVLDEKSNLQQSKLEVDSTELKKELYAIFGQDIQSDATNYATDCEFIISDTESVTTKPVIRKNVEKVEIPTSFTEDATEFELLEADEEQNNCGSDTDYNVLDKADSSKDVDNSTGEDSNSILIKFVATSEESSENEINDSIGIKKQYFEFNCELCTAKFDFQRDLMQHYEKDHDDRNLPFPCDCCDSRFVTKNTLRRHTRQIHQQCVYIDCQDCGRTVLKSFYKLHLKRAHSDKQKTYLCSQCPSSLTSKYTLKKHMARHAEERDRNFECLDCGRLFYTQENLQLHQIVHQDHRATYTCTLCDKTFMRQSNLKLHMQMHRGETMDCPHCGKKFVRRKDLEIHIRFHTGNFPFACSVCDRKFAIKGHLTAHARKHAGVRYKCSRLGCDKEFLNLSGLKQHSYEHTGMPLECKICKRGFPTKFKMHRHMRSVHHALFFEAGYSDELAAQYIQKKTESAFKGVLCSRGTEDYMEIVEVLEEHEHDIVQNMLKEHKSESN